MLAKSFARHVMTNGSLGWLKAPSKATQSVTQKGAGPVVNQCGKGGEKIATHATCRDIPPKGLNIDVECLLPF